VDGKPVLTAVDDLYGSGMAGLLAGADKERVSTPYFDNLLINAVNAPAPKAATAPPRNEPIYEALQAAR